MIKPQVHRALAIAIVALGIPSVVAAQQAAPDTPPRAEQELEAIFAEFQQIHLQLEEIQMQALQDPQLSATQEALGQEIRDAMESRDPSIRQRIERMESLETEAVDAQQTGNFEKLQALMTEAEAIEQHFATVQQEVLASPAIAAKIESFQTQLERRMAEVNPQTETLITRFRELESMLSAAVQGGA